MASVLPRKNPSGEIVWRVQFRIDGKPKQETFADIKEAEWFGNLVDRVGGKAAREVLTRRTGNVDSVPTLAEWTAQYLDTKSGMLTGITVGTRAGYHGIAGGFLHILGDFPIDSITRNDVGKWVEWQERQPSGRSKGMLIASKTVKNYHALLSNIFKAAVEQKLIVENPAHRTRISKGLSREAVFLSRDEFKALYEQIPTYYQPLVAFLVGSQARWSEATALDGRDLNRDAVPPTVRIAKAWTKNPDGPPQISVTKTPMGKRTVSLWPELLKLLGPCESGELLFKGPQSGRRIWYGSFNTLIWKPAVERAGLVRPPNIHDLRHTGASWLIADGKPLPHIQARLGHENITTTIKVYGHLLPDAHASMADSLAGIMSNVLPIRASTVLPVTR